MPYQLDFYKFEKTTLSLYELSRDKRKFFLKKKT